MAAIPKYCPVCERYGIKKDNRRHIIRHMEQEGLAD